MPSNPCKFPADDPMETGSVSALFGVDRWTPGVSRRRGVDLLAVIVSLAAIAVAVLWIGPLSRSDAIGSEGVLLGVLFGTLGARTASRHEANASRHQRSLDTVEGSIDDVSEDLRGASREALAALDRVRRSMQTRPIGYSPTFLPEVTGLISRATTSLRVLGDHPAYLIFSGAAAFDDYLEEMRSCVAKCAAWPPTLEVHFVFLAEDERRELHDLQVAQDAAAAGSWQAWRDHERLDMVTDDGGCSPGRLAAFWQRSAHILRSSDAALPSDLTARKFVDRLIEVNNAVRDRYFADAQNTELEFRDHMTSTNAPNAKRDGPSVYLWLRDEDTNDPEAIFVIAALGALAGGAREHAFLTHDPSLIRALVGTFERYRRSPDDWTTQIASLAESQAAG